MERVMHPERFPAAHSVRLAPESRFVIHLSDADVRCAPPDGSVEQVGWDDLQRVEILNTSDGPFLPDIFWVLAGSATGCVIPWGATGEKELLMRLQQLPGFDNEALLGLVGRTDDHRTLCWQRQPSLPSHILT